MHPHPPTSDIDMDHGNENKHNGSKDNNTPTHTLLGHQLVVLFTWRMNIKQATIIIYHLLSTDTPNNNCFLRPQLKSHLEHCLQVRMLVSRGGFMQHPLSLSTDNTNTLLRTRTPRSAHVTKQEASLQGFKRQFTFNVSCLCLDWHHHHYPNSA